MCQGSKRGQNPFSQEDVLNNAGVEAVKKQGIRFGRQEETKMEKPKKKAVIQLYRADTAVRQVTGIKVKQKIIYFSIYGYTDCIRFTFGIGMEYSSF